MRKILVLLPLLLVISTSGCTLINGGTTGESNVVTINSLTAIPNTVQAGQSTSIVAFIQNKGSARIPQTEDSNKITANLYDHCPGMFSLEGNSEQEIDSLSINELKQLDWELEQTPDAEVETSCDVKVSVKYPYRTTGLTTIHMINSDELARQIAENTYQSKNSDISKGDGPVKVWFEIVGEQPISVERSVSEQTLAIALKIENTGNGNLVENAVTIRDITIANTGAEDMITITDNDCQQLMKVQIASDNEGSEIVNLIQNNYEKICTAEINTELTNFPKESTVHATVTIEYQYEVTKEVKVTVKPEPV